MSAVPGLYFLAAVTIGFGADIYLAPSPRLPGWLVSPAGPVLTAAGALLFAAALLALRLSGTTIDTAKTASRLVTAGPYRVSRNPAYLGLAVACTGLSFWGNCLWAAVLLPVAVLMLDRRVVRREEASLARLFGPDYEEYSRRVRRWV